MEPLLCAIYDNLNAVRLFGRDEIQVAGMEGSECQFL